MDIKEQITQAVDKITKDEKLLEQFQKEPVKTVEKVLGVKLPADVVDKIVAGVKGKVSLNKAGAAVSALKKLF